MEKLLRKLLGAKSKVPPTETIEGIEETLAGLAAKRRECASAVSTVVARRNALLLNPDSDVEIARIDAETDARRLEIERIDAAVPILHAQLEALQSAARVKLRAELEGEYVAALNHYVAALQIVPPLWDRVWSAHEKLEGAGFHRSHLAQPEPLRNISRDALSIYLPFVELARREAEDAQRAAENAEAAR
jgi:hypothetical protein